MAFLIAELSLDKFKETWAISLLSVIVGAIIGFYLSRINIRYQVKRQARMNAAIELRSAFTDALVSLNSNVIKDNLAFKTFENEFTKHEAAFFRYKTYLSWYGKLRLQRAWNRYSCKKDRERLQQESKDYYTNFPCMEYDLGLKKVGNEFVDQEFTPENEFDKRKLVRKRIDKMLKIV